MAATTAPRSTVKLNDNKLKNLPVAAGTMIFQGSLIASDAGLAVPASAKASLVVLGMAKYGADNRSGAAGDARVELERGVFAWDNDAAAPVTQAIIGKPCYAVDDQTVSSSSSANTRPQAGIVYQVDEAGVWVETL